MKKRILSVISAIIISLTLLVSAMPASAFTYNNNQLEEYAMRVVDLVNKLRADVSAQDGIYRAPLQVLKPLCDAAQVRAAELKDKYSHTRPNGTDWSTVLAEFNIERDCSHAHDHVGENIHHGINTPEAAMNGWINSQEHYQNMITPDYNYIGVGVAQINGHYYWEQAFLREFKKTDLQTPSSQTMAFNKNGLTNAFTVEQVQYNPYVKYSMFFSVANEADKTVYFHGVNTKEAARVEVPGTVVNPNNGTTYTVRYIGDTPKALTQNLELRQSIRYLEVPETVVSFSQRAFYNGSLISVRVAGPNSQLTTIPQYTFMNCYELLSVGFQCCPKLNSINQYAFYMCNNLASINFAQNGTNIKFASSKQSVFGAKMRKTTLLFMPNNTNTTKNINLFSIDKANWSNGKLKIYTSKSKVYENNVLRAQNSSSTLRRVTPQIYA